MDQGDMIEQATRSIELKSEADQEKEIDEMIASVKGESWDDINKEIAKNNKEFQRQNRILYQYYILDKVKALGLKNESVTKLSELNIRQEIKQLYWHIIYNEHLEKQNVVARWAI